MATATTPARTAKKATKTVATRKVAAKKVSAPPKKSPTQVMLNGEAASNRHFLVDRELFEVAMDRCSEDGINISDVMRHGLEVYGRKAPAVDAVRTGPPVLPRSALTFLKKAYQSGDSALVNEYLAACHRAGWTVQSLADSMVASGAVERMSRQAASLRMLKAPEEPSVDLPAVPEVAHRRVMTSPRRGKTKEQFAAAGKKQKRQRAASTYDLSFRITDTHYEFAARRAQHENAMMSKVLDEIMANYVAGDYDKVFRRSQAPVSKTAPKTVTRAAAKTVIKPVTKTTAKTTTRTAPVKKSAAKKAVARKAPAKKVASKR